MTISNYWGTDGQKDVQTDKQTDRQTERRTDRRTDTVGLRTTICMTHLDVAFVVAGTGRGNRSKSSTVHKLHLHFKPPLPVGSCSKPPSPSPLLLTPSRCARLLIGWQCETVCPQFTAVFTVNFENRTTSSSLSENESNLQKPTSAASSSPARSEIVRP